MILQLTHYKGSAQSNTFYKAPGHCWPQGNYSWLVIVSEGASLTTFGCVNSRLESYHAGTVVPEWVSSFYSLIIFDFFIFLTEVYLICFKIHKYWVKFYICMGFQGVVSGKEPACQCKRQKRCSFDSRVGKIPWRSAWQTTPVFLLEESHGQRSLEGYSPWGRRVWSDLACMHYIYICLSLDEGERGEWKSWLKTQHSLCKFPRSLCAFTKQNRVHWP